MNEQNFDKILKQQMAEERDFPFSDEKWDKMERKLDDFHAKKRYERLVWASALSFAGLLSVLLFVVWQLRDTQRNLLDLTQDVQKLPNAEQPVVSDSIQKGSVIKRDTVYHHIIVKRYDTIFQTVVQRGSSETDFKKIGADKTIVPSKTNISEIDSLFVSAKKADLSIQSAINDDKIATSASSNLSADKQAPKSEISIPKSDIVPPLSILNKNDSVKLSSTITTESMSKINADNNQSEISLNKPEIDTLKSEISIPKSDIVPPLSIAEEKESNKRKPILKPLKLNGYEIGLSGGSAFIGDKDRRQQMGYSVGLRGGVGLGQRFKVVGEAQYVGSYYKLNSFSSRNDIPTVNPPTVNDELSHIQVRQSGGRVFLGVQYNVTRSRLRPFVGLGAVGVFETYEKYRFKFINRLTNEETLVTAQNRSKDFEDVYWRVSAGLSYPIFKKLNVQLEGSLDAPFDHKHNYQPLLQLKGAVLYRF